MQQFSVPYNNHPQTIGLLAEFLESKSGKKIREMYMAGSPSFFGSGRAIAQTTAKRTFSAIKFCHEHGIGANLLLNSGCGGAEWYKPSEISAVLRYLKKLDSKEGLDAVTIANPIYLQRIRAELPDISIVTSAFSGIDSVERAVFYKKFGADVITPNGINRDLELLKEMREETGLELRLMVNEGCIHNCPYRLAHINYISHASQKTCNPPDVCAEGCIILRRINPSLLLKCDWIRPEDLKKYRKITDYFKIVGRVRDAEWIIKTTSAYVNETYEGNLLDLLECISSLIQQYGAYIDNRSLDGFFEKATTCGRKCHTCGYCDGLARKIVKFKK